MNIPYQSLPCLTAEDYIHAVFFSTQTFLGVLYHNENEAEGITSILKKRGRGGGGVRTGYALIYLY